MIKQLIIIIIILWLYTLS